MYVSVCFCGSLHCCLAPSMEYGLWR
uniref:Uncharacterized protein n=1 Tax=Arundo donax TaxID=35708 RepID=A0A0A8ZJG7_ARUDO